MTQAVTISVITPTCGRSTLQRAIESVVPQLRDGDELLVVGDGRQPAAERTVRSIGHPQVDYLEHGPTGFYGNAQRNYAAAQAHGDYLAFLDDDDLSDPQGLDTIRRAAEESGRRPLMFCIRCLDPPWEKWSAPVFANENISGGAFAVPNIPDRLGRWPDPSEPEAVWGDRFFIEQTLRLWPDGLDALVWRKEHICHVPRAGNNAP